MIKNYFKKTNMVLAVLFLLPFFVAAQINLVQTTNNAITVNTVVACGSNNVTAANSFARLYNLNMLGYSSFTVTKVSFAVQGFALGSAVNYPVAVEVYSSTGGVEENSLTYLGGSTVNITAAMVNNLVEVSLPVPVLVAAEEMLIVVSAPDGQQTSTGFYIGGNSNGQTSPSYIKASSCGINSFTSFVNIGNPNAHVVLFPTGNAAVLGVESFDASNKTVLFYPNPVKSVLNFSEEVSKFTIADISGRIIKKVSGMSKSADFEELENGNYIITATTNAGNAISRKIVKN